MSKARLSLQEIQGFQVDPYGRATTAPMTPPVAQQDFELLVSPQRSQTFSDRTNFVMVSSNVAFCLGFGDVDADPAIGRYPAGLYPLAVKPGQTISFVLAEDEAEFAGPHGDALRLFAVADTFSAAVGLFRDPKLTQAAAADLRFLAETAVAATGDAKAAQERVAAATRELEAGQQKLAVDQAELASLKRQMSESAAAMSAEITKISQDRVAFEEQKRQDRETFDAMTAAAEAQARTDATAIKAQQDQRDGWLVARQEQLDGMAERLDARQVQLDNTAHALAEREARLADGEAALKRTVDRLAAAGIVVDKPAA